MDIAISKIIRSRRRSISFEICEDATLIIRAPLYLAEKELYRILETKKNWVINKQRFVAGRNSSTPEKKFCCGEKFLYLGNEYSLRIINSLKPPLDFNNEFLLSSEHIPQAKDLFIAWYKNAARRVVCERIPIYSRLLHVQPDKITITGAKSRWGSCAGRANVNFSWRLVMAPRDIIDYVIVHELSHITEKNHSKNFWHKVSGVVPQYKQYRNWLKLNGHILVV